MKSPDPPVGAHGLVASPAELAAEVSSSAVYIAFGVVLPIALAVIGIGFFISAYRHSIRGLERD